ncbi:MAG: F0F1 ATP synthase subunit A [candidate division Zixibacteria bacterium]|nr:F0F1 ATP synthase subunit A [candidate division Zixibacteria bacterium]
MRGFWSGAFVLPLAGGGEQEAHHSILHGVLLLLGPFKEMVPQPSRQPDLLLNTLFVLGVVFALVFVVVRRFQRIPTGSLQNLFEMVVEGLNDFFFNIVGERGKKYIPFFGSFFIYILLMNMLGLVPGFQAPTADLNTTLGFGLISVIAANLIGLREAGLKAYLKHFWGEPTWLGPLMCPLHIVGEFAKILSLTVRLFGNVFGEETVIFVLAGLSPVILLGSLEVPFIPLQLPMMLFAVFTGTVQALIFSVLSAVYTAQFLEEHHEEHH